MMAGQETTGVGDSVEAEFGSTDEATAEVASTPKKTAKKGPQKPSMPKGYVRIMLEESDEIPPSGLYIGVNDKSYLLMPGVEVPVPQGVVDVLENAVMSTPRIDPQSKRVVGYKDRHRYPFRRV